MKEYKVTLSYGGLMTRDGILVDLIPSEINFIAMSLIDRYKDAKDGAVKECLKYLAEALGKASLSKEDYPIKVRWNEYQRNTWKKNPDWRFVKQHELSIPWR